MQILLSNLTYGQNYIDTIITKLNDKIICQINEINDQNIFYTYQKKTKKIDTYISLNNTVNYNWLSKNLPKSNIKDNSYPYDSTNAIKIQILVGEHLNYPVKKFASINLGPYYSQTNFVIGVTKGNHELFGGIEHTYKINDFDDEIKFWEIRPIGAIIGYTYFAPSKWKKINLILQLHFSIFKIIETDYHNRQGVTKNNYISIRNSGLIGMNYKLFEKIELFGSIGIVSERFFLIILGYNPCINLGLRYNLIK